MNTDVIAIIISILAMVISGYTIYDNRQTQAFIEEQIKARQAELNSER